MIVGLGFGRDLALSNRDGEDEVTGDKMGPSDAEIGSGMMRRELIQVGGLFSRRERVMHQEP